MTTTAIPELKIPRKIVWDFEPDLTHVFAADVTGLPEPVVVANATARHAIERYRAAKDAAADARDAITDAERFDAVAREAALAVDKPAPAPTAGARRAEAIELDKQIDATRKIARREIVALYRAVAENYPVYVQGRREALAAAEAEPMKLARKLAAAWPRVARERALLQLAEQFHEQPVAIPLSETRRPPKYDRAEETIRDELRRRGRRGDASVPLDLTHVIAALGVLLELED